MIDLAEVVAYRDQKLAERAAAKAAWSSSRSKLAQAEEYWYAAEEAQETVQAIAETVQQAAHARIAGVVSKCLAAVFDEPYDFQIEFERSRGRTEARLVFVRNGEPVNPIDSSGGGVIDVAAFALRVSCLLLHRPACRRCIVMDEPFKFVSAEYQDRVRALLESLADDLDVQFIMVTHIDALRAGTVVEVG